MYMSVKELDAAETQGSIAALKHVPGTDASHDRSTGSQLNMVANSNPVCRQITNAMPRLMKVFVNECIENIRR